MSTKQESPLKPYFDQLVDVWRYMSDKDRVIKKDFPEEIGSRLDDLGRDMEKMSVLQKQMYNKMGMEPVEDLRGFIVENHTSFDKKDLDFLVQMEKLKREISFFKDKLKEVVEVKIEEKGGVTKKDKSLRKSRRNLKNLDRNI